MPALRWRGRKCPSWMGAPAPSPCSWPPVRPGSKVRWAAGVVIVLGGLLNMGMFLRMGGDFLVQVCGVATPDAQQAARESCNRMMKSIQEGIRDRGVVR